MNTGIHARLIAVVAVLALAVPAEAAAYPVAADPPGYTTDGSARPIDPPAAIDVALANHVQPQAAAAAALEAKSAPSGTTAVSSGFNWGDAAIGAGAGFATMIGLGGLLVLSSRRHRGEQPAPSA